MIFAPIFATLMMHWPPYAFVGALGFSPLSVACGLFALPFFRFSSPPRTYAILASVFIVWTAASWSWSPGNTVPLFSGDPRTDSFAIKASWLRLVPVALTAMLLIGAALRIPQGRPRVAAGMILSAFLLHAALILPMPLYQDALLQLAYSDPQKAATDGVTNILRNANAFALAMPVLVAWVWQKGLPGRLSAIILSSAAAISFTILGGLAPLLAVLGMALAILLVRLLPQRGFKVLFGTLGVSVLFTPALLASVAEFIQRFQIQIPPSAMARAWAWEETGRKILEQPLTGHGLEASETWRETYNSRPELLTEIEARGFDMNSWMNYPIIPGHPHNMAMEIWAETGVVGALLTAFALVALGWRLPAPQSLAAPLWMATAGIAGAAFFLFSFSYSAWNEAFWGALVLVAASAILIAKAEPTSNLPIQ